MRAATRRPPSICSAVPSPCCRTTLPDEGCRSSSASAATTQEMGRAQSVLTDAVAEAERADDQVAAALASLGLLMIQASTRPSELSDSLGEAERLAASLERVGDEAGARLAQAFTATLLFYIGRAGEATQRARALVEFGDGNEMWQRGPDGHGGVAGLGPTPAETVISELRAQKERAHGSPWARGADRGSAG